MRLADSRRAIATIVASLILFISPLRGQDEARALWVVLAEAVHGPEYVAQVGLPTFAF